MKLPLEGPGPAIGLAVGAACCFGLKSLTLKYMAIKEGIDGISASAVLLQVDGLIGGVIGIILAACGKAYATFPAGNIVLGIFSGCFAGAGVLCINIAVNTGVAGPAFAIANLCCVI